MRSSSASSTKSARGKALSKRRELQLDREFPPGDGVCGSLDGEGCFPARAWPARHLGLCRAWPKIDPRAGCESGCCFEDHGALRSDRVSWLRPLLRRRKMLPRVVVFTSLRSSRHEVTTRHPRAQLLPSSRSRAWRIPARPEATSGFPKIAGPIDRRSDRIGAGRTWTSIGRC